MLLSGVTLKDYGAYAGRHRFELDVAPSKPIILIGGLNGGGKTTLFESVPLCLYGRLHAGGGRKSYEGRLAGLVHRRRGGGLAEADARTSVTVEFRTCRGGVLAEYRVERSWGPDGTGEELRVMARKGGELEYSDLDGVERDQWQAFINGLIPRRIADLFFFDGERVTQMTDPAHEGAVIRSSFTSLLGLDVVERLSEDLRTNLVRNLSGDDKHLAEECRRLEDEKSQAEARAGRLRESRARKEAELRRVRGGIEEAEASLDRIGGSFAEKRGELRARLGAERAKLEEAGRRMAKLCAAELPFSLIPLQMEGVRSRMDMDHAAARDALERGAASRALDRVGAEVASGRFARGMDPRLAEDVASRVLDVIEGARPGPPGEAGGEVLGLSAPQRAAMLRVLEAAGGPVIEAAREAALECAGARERVAELEAALASAPADDEIGPVVSEIGKMRNMEGMLEGEADHLDRQVASHEALIKGISSKIRGVLEGRYRSRRNRRMAELTKNVQETLEIYARNLRAGKMGLLEAYILEAAGVLMHKRDFIGSVSVDPETFRVEVRGRDGVPVPHDSMSKGERQMLATSVLWALARTSGRPLPFMIDTPLARLDGGHRTNMVERFLPLASHQTLVFSTDTEIGPSYHARLLPYVSRSYTVRYSPESGGTVPSEGYFAEGDER